MDKLPIFITQSYRPDPFLQVIGVSFFQAEKINISNNLPLDIYYYHTVLPLQHHRNRSTLMPYLCYSRYLCYVVFVLYSICVMQYLCYAVFVIRYCVKRYLCYHLCSICVIRYLRYMVFVLYGICNTVFVLCGICVIRYLCYTV